MEKEGLGTVKIIKTVNNLRSASKALDFYKNKALYKHVSFLAKNKCSINTQIFAEEAGEIIFKSFADILSFIDLREEKGKKEQRRTEQKELVIFSV